VKVLLSIKPEYAEKIFDGHKKYEYRRVLFKDKNVNKVIIYMSSPVKKVVGEFEIEDILFENIDELWRRTYNGSGITKELFYKYFIDKEKGYAMKIKNVTKYSTPINLEKEFNVSPPQSFVYLT